MLSRTTCCSTMNSSAQLALTILLAVLTVLCPCVAWLWMRRQTTAADDNDDDDHGDQVKAKECATTAHDERRIAAERRRRRYRQRRRQWQRQLQRQQRQWKGNDHDDDDAMRVVSSSSVPKKKRNKSKNGKVRQKRTKSTLQEIDHEDLETAARGTASAEISRSSRKLLDTANEENREEVNGLDPYYAGSTWTSRTSSHRKHEKRHPSSSVSSSLSSTLSSSQDNTRKVTNVNLESGDADHPMRQSPIRISLQSSLSSKNSSRRYYSRSRNSTANTINHAGFVIATPSMVVKERQACSNGERGRSHRISTTDLKPQPREAPPDIPQDSRRVDVHSCQSKTCPLCRNKNKKRHVQFISAQRLEPGMIFKMQSGSARDSRWWEVGESFFDLYQRAQVRTAQKEEQERMVAVMAEQKRRHKKENSVWGFSSRSAPRW